MIKVQEEHGSEGLLPRLCGLGVVVGNAQKAGWTVIVLKLSGFRIPLCKTLEVKLRANFMWVLPIDMYHIRN